ncbi:MAG TPA: winged helix-turn-helix domain-containing protein [Candidatus Methylomirabilis sp.]|nr:winged helix-turn-helix domain-containing protein [Candidatus Methylomirabilis sp.]
MRFDVFEVDLRAAELYKSGRKVKLQIQPLHILAMLLEHPGELLTREELRKRLWPADTFVDFDHSLNTAVKKLRQALGDDKKKPRFIETLPKRGYRFIGTVKGPAPRPAQAMLQPFAGEASWVGRIAKLRCEDGATIALLAVDEATATEREKLQAAGDDVGISILIASHRLLMAERDTPLRILEMDQTLSRCQVRILEGEHYGKTALVPVKLLALSQSLRSPD